MAGRIHYRGPGVEASPLDERQFDNMLKETIFAATQTIRKSLGEDDWCGAYSKTMLVWSRLTVNTTPASKLKLTTTLDLEPYGANTGIGGVIRDPMALGWGKPVQHRRVCFAPGTDVKELPPVFCTLAVS